MSIGPRDKPYPLVTHIDSVTGKPVKLAEASAIYVSSVSAISISATNYYNLPQSASYLSGLLDVSNPLNATTGQSLIWSSTKWIASSVAFSPNVTSLAGTGVFATTASLAAYETTAYSRNNYVLTSTNNNLSSAFSNHLASAVHWDLNTLNTNYINASGDSTNAGFYFSSLSGTTISATTYQNLPLGGYATTAQLQGYETTAYARNTYATTASLQSYVLTSTNSNLSSAFNNHLASAVHWDLNTLNTNYINASGDSTNAGFYFSSLSGTTISATTYQNLPLGGYATTAQLQGYETTAYARNTYETTAYARNTYETTAYARNTYATTASLSNYITTGNGRFSSVTGTNFSALNISATNVTGVAANFSSVSSNIFYLNGGKKNWIYYGDPVNGNITQSGGTSGLWFSATASLLANDPANGSGTLFVQRVAIDSNGLILGQFIENVGATAIPPLNDTPPKFNPSLSSRYRILYLGPSGNIGNLSTTYFADSDLPLDTLVTPNLSSLNDIVADINLYVLNGNAYIKTISATTYQNLPSVTSLNGTGVFATTASLASYETTAYARNTYATTASLQSYVLTSTNSNLSSAFNNHLASAVHWDLATLNANYINASGDSANAEFYFSSLSGTTISATTYRNLPAQALSGLSDTNIASPLYGQSLVWDTSKWVASSVAGGGGGGGTPGGSTTQVQYNSGGSFAGSPAMTFIAGTNTFSATNIVSVNTSSTNIYLASAIQFNVATAPTLAVGQLAWNSTDQTLDIQTTVDTTLQVGQEQVMLVENKSGATIANGKVVYVSGTTGGSGKLSVGLAAASSTNSETAFIIGVATQEIPDNSSGFVTTFGKVNGIPLPTAQFNDGDIAYLGDTPGELRNYKPGKPSHGSFQMGRVIRAHDTNGILFVTIRGSVDSTELHDVASSLPSDGQVLVWNNASSMYIPNNVSAISGIDNYATTGSLAAYETTAYARNTYETTGYARNTYATTASLQSYVLTSTNSNLSSAFNNHLASAIHWDLNTLNTNYINASGDSANAAFYFSSLSGTTISATTYLNLPLAGYATTAALQAYALTASLASYETTAYARNTYATTASLSNYITTGNGRFSSLTGTNFSALNISATTYLNLPSVTSLAGTGVFETTAYARNTYALTASLASYETTAYARNNYVLTSVNTNLSSAFSNHLASAVHWDLNTLNTNYINASGDSANAGFYFSSLSGATVSAITYLNLPTSALSGLSDVSSPLNPVNGQVLTWSSTKWVASSVAAGGGGGTPGGSDTQVQYNNAGTFAGSPGMTYNNPTQTLTITNISATTYSNLGPSVSSYVAITPYGILNAMVKGLICP